MKKCAEYEVDDARPRGRPKKTWKEIVEKKLPGTCIEQGGCHGS